MWVKSRLEFFRKLVAWPVPLLVWVFFLSGHSCRLEILRHQMVENLPIETFKVLVIIIKIFLTTLRLQYRIGGCIWPQWSGGQHNIYQYCTLNVLTAGRQSSTQLRLQWLIIWLIINNYEASYLLNSCSSPSLRASTWWALFVNFSQKPYL